MTNIMLVGEAFGEKEEKLGKPFVGPSGGLLNAFLAATGIARHECYLTNVLNFRPPGNNLKLLCGPKSEGIPGMPALFSGKYLRAEYKKEVDRLLSEVRAVNPTVVCALGNTACWALLGSASIKKLRGSPTIGVTGHKVLPTYHPAAVLREYKLRPIVFSDFKKLAAESHFPEVRRPQRELWLEPSLDDLATFESYILSAKEISVDIETWNRQITCIGFAPSSGRAIVIPFIYRKDRDCNYWRSLDEELAAWGYVRKWLSLGKTTIGQNFLYDCSYLWPIYGIALNGPVEDTMLLQHAAQPEMEKSLGFLGSIYTSEPRWKFMRKDIKTLKKED